MPREVIKFNADDGKKVGSSWFAYSPPFYGKSTLIRTIPFKNIKVYWCDRKDPRRTLRGTDKNIDIIIPGGFDNAMEELNSLHKEIEGGNPNNWEAIVFDPLSFFMNEITLELEDSRHEQRLTQKKREDTLTDRYKLEFEDYHKAASMMCRISNLLCGFTQYGLFVYGTSVLKSAPSWDRELEAAPAFIGKEFSQQFSGYWDFIFMLDRNPRKDEKGNPKLYPPIAKFVSHDKSFLAGCRSNKMLDLIKEKGDPVADFSKLLPLDSMEEDTIEEDVE